MPEFTARDTEFTVTSFTSDTRRVLYIHELDKYAIHKRRPGVRGWRRASTLSAPEEIVGRLERHSGDHGELIEAVREYVSSTSATIAIVE